MKANINAAVIVVEGTVDGDLTGDDAVIIKSTGKVTGNVTVPRITLEDGASFNGRINMKPKEGQSYGVEDKADGRLGGDIKVVGE